MALRHRLWWEVINTVIREVLERWIGEVDGIICNGPSCKVDEALLSKAPKLKVVSTVSVGVDHIGILASYHISHVLPIAA